MEKQIIKSGEYIKKAIQLKSQLEKTFIELAEHLYHIYNQKLWQEESYGSWDEFLIDLKLPTPTASKLMSVYRTYVVECGVSASKIASVRSWEGLYAVRSLATSKEKAIELVECGVVESDKDMRSKVNGKVECDEHEYYTVRICKNCNQREKVYDENMANLRQ